ncbi:MAG: efflux RND transporter periplasmic adaptor subunit [Smithellaceae bacterium]|jgi:RND family efflux transporter MFP subunit
MPTEDLKKLKIEKADKVIITAGRKKKPFIIAAIILMFLIFVILYRVGIIAPAITVDVTTVSQVYPSQSLSILNASGYIVAQRKAAVASKMTGRLVALNVEEGSKVKKGQIIAQMESADVSAAKDQAAANLNTVRANLEQVKADRDNLEKDHARYQRLAEGGYVAQSEYDALNTRYKRAIEGVKAAEAAAMAAAASLTGAKANLDYTLIRAPFDGVVLTKNADVGDIVTPLGAAATAKAAVVTIADMSSLQVEVDVSETSIASIRVGQPCDIQLDALADMRFRGEVHAIVPTVDRTKATVLVKVRFLDKDPRMLPDMSAKVSFLSRNLKPEELKPRIAVSQSALINRGDQNIVFLLRGNHVQQTSLQLGEKLGEMMEIKAGLKPGDRVVINPPTGLKDGSKIKIAER